ncbi:MAG: caspase family protein [Bacteroidota bacterium]
MIRIVLIIWAIILPVISLGQCDGLIVRAEEDIAARLYKPAIDKLLLLQEECPSQSKRINGLIQYTFSLIEQDRNRADSLAASFERSNQIMKAILDRQRNETFTSIAEGNLPNLYVLAVGNGSFKSPQLNLESPENDITRILDSWGRSNWLFGEIKNYTLTNESAKKETILRRIREIVAQSSPRDIVYIHFSGHGMDAGPREGSFLTAEFDLNNRTSPEGLICGEELFDVLKQEDAFVMLFLDFAKSDKSLEVFRQAAVGDDPQDFLHRVFGFGLEGEAYARQLNGKSYGMLTYASGAVITNADYDLDGNGALYLDEYPQGLLQVLKQTVSAIDGRQVRVVVPATISNIPIRQFQPQFAFPKEEKQIR